MFASDNMIIYWKYHDWKQQFQLLSSHLKDLSLHVGLHGVVGCRQHMNALPIPQYPAEDSAKGQKDFLGGILGTWLALLPAGSIPV